MNRFTDEFNQTVGAEQNIRVQVGSVSNTNTIHESVLASAYGDPGTTELPDMFVSYPKTVLALPDENILVDYRDYLTEEEQNAFIPEFMEEGTVHATEPLRTGDAIVSVASSASVLYYSNIVTYPDNTTEEVEIISLPCPIFEGGEKLVRLKLTAGQTQHQEDPDALEELVQSTLAGFRSSYQ